MSLGREIKTALENVVFCRGANPAKESYEYAEKMGRALKESIANRLDQIIDSEEDTNELLEKLIEELKG
jgi:glycerol-3-phosphate dehydrogenase